jgi:hypothetical protein
MCSAKAGQYCHALGFGAGFTAIRGEKRIGEGLAFHALGRKLPAGGLAEEVLLNLSDENFALAVFCAEILLCTAGYSNLCDLLVLSRPDAMLFQTPVQTEQVYLALRWKEKQSKFVSEKGNSFTLQSLTASCYEPLLY